MVGEQALLIGIKRPGMTTGQMEASLAELEILQKPVIKVYNKCDRGDLYIRDFADGIKVSALKGCGLDVLAAEVEKRLKIGFKHARLRLPITYGSVLSEIYRIGSVVEVRHSNSGIFIRADLPEKLLGKYRKYCI